MELHFKLDKNVDFVFAYLTDMQKFVAVHPIIYKIKNTGNNRYLVYEKLKLGFIPVSFTYPVRVEQNEGDQRVFITATVFGITKIEMKFVLSSQKNCTYVQETITFSSPLPIKRLMMRIFRKQHHLLFKNINDL
jgi:carbon monoxide dehydrogenase subunit G